MSEYEVLFDEKSKEEYSPYFAVPTNGLVVIQAFGFVGETEGQVTVEVDGVVYTTTQKFEQGACVHMALFMDPGLPPTEPCQGGIIDLSKYAGVLKIEEIVMKDDCPWQITACNNIVLLDLPGQYRLKLNDPAAVGIVRVYARFLSKNDFKANSLLYLGG